MANRWSMLFLIWYASLLLPSMSGFNIITHDNKLRIVIQKPDNKKNISTDINNSSTTFFGYNLLFDITSNQNKTFRLTITDPNMDLQSQQEDKANQTLTEVYHCDIMSTSLQNLSSSYVPQCNPISNYSNVTTHAYTIASRQTDRKRNQTAICNPYKKQRCGSIENYVGSCYVSTKNNSRMKWLEKIPCRDECNTTKMDIMFVLDGSRSVRLENFNIVKNWTKEVVRGFDLSSRDQVGIVQYSYWSKRSKIQQFTRTEIKLGQYKTRNLFNEAVDNISFIGASTYTAHAILKTVDEDFNGPTSRYPDVKRVMVLLTDGFASDPDDLPRAVKYARDNGIVSFAVGVGSVDYNELLMVAGRNDRVFTVHRFDALQNIVKQLQQEIQILESPPYTNITNNLKQCQAGFAAKFDEIAFALYLLLLKNAHSFNVATKTEQIIRPTRNSPTSYFGYNLDFINNDRSTYTKILSGSPNQGATNLKGSVLECGIDNQHITLSNRSNCNPYILLPNKTSELNRDGQNSFGITISGSKTKYGTSVITCSPLLQRECFSTKRAEGTCWIENSNINRTMIRNPCYKSCRSDDIDLMFVIDGSRSVRADNFAKVKTWIKQVTSHFNITSPVQVGVVQYSTYYRWRTSQPYMKTEVALGEFKNKSQFDEAVDKIVYQSRTTFTANAIYKTVEEDFKGNTSRYPEARRVMVLLTDGQSTDKETLPSATRFAEQAGVESFAVGVGSQFVYDELLLIAGSESRVLTVDSYDDLFSITQKLQRDIQILEDDMTH